MESRLSILQTDIQTLKIENIVRLFGSKPSLILANPPYVDPEDRHLSREVGLFEPPLALFSNKGGMAHIISWFEKAMSCLSHEGIYIFELGWSQEERAKAFLDTQKELAYYEIHKDLGGNPRMAVCFKK